MTRVRHGSPRGMIALKADLGDPRLVGTLREASGLDTPGVGEARVSGDSVCLWMAPDELLLLIERSELDDALDRFRRATAGCHALVEDVSDMRVRLVLEGEAVRDVLARATPADVSPAALPPGRVRRTRLGQVAGALWLVDPARVEVLCARSVADYVFELLDEAAASEPLRLHHVDARG